MLVRYFNNPKSKGIKQNGSFPSSGDIGFEKGDGVNGFKDNDKRALLNDFASAMIYNRIWFAVKNKLAWTVGGGIMNNPGPLPRIVLPYRTGKPFTLIQTIRRKPKENILSAPILAINSKRDCSTNLDFDA